MGPLMWESHLGALVPEPMVILKVHQARSQHPVRASTALIQCKQENSGTTTYLEAPGPASVGGHDI